MLQQEKDLEHRQHKQRERGGIPPANAGARGLQLLALFLAQILKTGGKAGKVQHITVDDACAVFGHFRTVDPHVLVAKHIEDAPLAVIKAAQNGVDGA